MLNAIELNTGHKVASAETEIEAISYEPHISSILNAEPHEGLMLLRLSIMMKWVNLFYTH